MIELQQNSTTIISPSQTSAITSKKRREARLYYFTNCYENLEEAMNFVKKEKYGQSRIKKTAKYILNIIYKISVRNMSALLQYIF